MSTAIDTLAGNVVTNADIAKDPAITSETIYRTSDGQTFSTILEAENHEQLQNQLAEIDAFVATLGYKPQFAAAVRTQLAKWEAHRIANLAD